MEAEAAMKRAKVTTTVRKVRGGYTATVCVRRRGATACVTRTAKTKKNAVSRARRAYYTSAATYRVEFEFRRRRR